MPRSWIMSNRIRLLEKVNINDLVAHVTVGTTGNVTFYINGNKVNASIDSNGLATLTGALEIGLNNVVAVYAGDINYTGSQANKNFTVGTIDSEVNVTATTVVYGNDTEITVKNLPNLDGMNAVTVHLVKGERYTMRSLVEVMLVASANDAAYVVAEGVAGSADKFVTLMNSKAKELGIPIIDEETVQYVVEHEVFL